EPLRDWFLTVAPRKPERFDAVASILPHDAVRRSSFIVRPSTFLLLDSVGELARIYRYATCAFIGGSLLPGVGGHNPIEAAAVGVPICFGPYMSNFREIASTFLRHDAAVEARSATDVVAFATQMFDDST